MDHPAIPELDLTAWSDQLMERLGSRRYPLACTFEITERCNLRCVHCYINQPAGSAAATSELTTAQVTSILDQLVDAGLLFLTLTGGEPLLRSDFPEIYRYARQRGLLVNLFTNATLVTPVLADLLAELPPRLVDVTMYGATPHTYEQVTGIPGSYARFRRGIQLLQERGLPLYLKSVLLTTNLPEIEEMRAFAEELGVQFRYDGVLWPRLDGSHTPLSHQVSLEDLIELDRRDPERQKAWEKQAELCADHPSRNEYIYNCGAGLRSFQIDSAGTAYICAMSRKYGYDLQEMGFQQAWQSIGELRKIKRKRYTPCQTCTVGALCTQCPGWSQSIHQDDETTVEFVCALGRLRAEEIRYNQNRSFIEEISNYAEKNLPSSID